VWAAAVLIVNWRGTDALVGGSAKAPTDDGLLTGKPDALDGAGREFLELRELAVNYSTEDPCIWLRKKDNTLAKFRPTAGVRVVDKVTDLPVPGTPQAKALKSGDAFLVRFAPDGTTGENRLVVWDEQINTPGPMVGGAATTIQGGWNWAVEPRTFIKQLAASADVATTGAAGHKLVEGDLQLTIEPGVEELKVFVKGAWVTVFSWQRLRDNFPINHWAARAVNLPVPVVGRPITDGSTYMVQLDLDGQSLDRMMVWRELTAETTAAGGVKVPQTGEWHVVDQTTWVKSLNSDRDNTTDAKGGDLTVTLEKDKESIKVFDAKAGAWVTVPATDSETVRRWIASLSLFQGTVVEGGAALPGAIDFDALPDLSNPKLDSLKALSAHYWIFVGASGTTINSTDPNGLGRDVNGARLNPGDWIMISNRSTDPAVVDAHWVTVSGDLLSATRARALYSHETWRPGSYEAGTVIVHNKSLWRALSAVTVSDGEPVDGVNVAQVDTIDLTVAAGLAAGADFTIRVDGHAATYITQVVGESAAVITAKLITALNTEPLITALVKVEAGMVTGGVVNPANAQIKLTALTAGVPFTVTVSRTELAITHVKANVTVSPWVKLDLAAGVRWVPTDAERDAITNSPRQDIIYVLSSAEARGNGALYYYDSANTKWMPFGGAGIPLKLTGGHQLLSVGCPIGSMMMWPSAVAPAGWLLCDGSAFTAAAYPELAKVLPGLKLPDMRGAYPRGAGLNGNGTWGSAANATLGRQEDATARPKTAFTATTNTAGAHTHSLQLRASNNSQNLINWDRASASTASTGWWQADGGATNEAGGHTHVVTIDGGGDSETRPKTILLGFIIKVDDSTVVMPMLTP